MCPLLGMVVTSNVVSPWWFQFRLPNKWRGGGHEKRLFNDWMEEQARCSSTLPSGGAHNALCTQKPWAAHRAEGGEMLGHGIPYGAESQLIWHAFDMISDNMVWS